MSIEKTTDPSKKIESGEKIPPTLQAWLSDSRFSKEDKDNWKNQFLGGQAPRVPKGKVYWDSSYLPEEVEAVMSFTGMLDLTVIYPDGRLKTKESEGNIDLQHTGTIMHHSYMTPDPSKGYWEEGDDSWEWLDQKQMKNFEPTPDSRIEKIDEKEYSVEELSSEHEGPFSCSMGGDTFEDNGIFNVGKFSDLKEAIISLKNERNNKNWAGFYGGEIKDKDGKTVCAFHDGTSEHDKQYPDILKIKV